MATTMMPRSEPLRKNFIGKVRRTFSGGSGPKQSDSPDTSQEVDFIKPKVTLDNAGVSVRTKGRKSIWRKVSGGKEIPPVPDVPPALYLNLDDKEQEKKVDSVQAANSSIRRGSISKRKAAPLTPAAAVALAASSKPVSVPPGAKVKYHQIARLNVVQATKLIQLCSQEIRMRGLATMGIFRPFRAAESLIQQERLIELFLLYVEPKTYGVVFSESEVTGSSLMQDTLGKTDAEGEFKKKLSFANIHDVIALLKWSVRRLKLQPEDLDSLEQYSWYESFVEKEKEAEYPLNAYSTFFLSSLPSDTQLLFNTVFELMSSISAHHVANAMSASKLCKDLGFWMIGRIGTDYPPHDLQSVIHAWEKSARVMEHLLMAYVRDESTRVHLMPSRLMEIVKDYPHFGLAHPTVAVNQNTPALEHSLSSMKIKALLVEMRSENIVVSSKQHRGPRETFRAVLKAQGSNLEGSEELDDWSAILGVACGATASPSAKRESYTSESKNAEEDVDARKEAALLTEEDARVLQIVSNELERRKMKSESKPEGAMSVSASQSTFLSDLGAINVDEYRFSTHNTEALGWSSLTNSSSVNSMNQKHSLRRQPSALGTLSENKNQSGQKDWSTFTSSGFDADKDQDADLNLRLNEAFRAKTAVDRALEEEERLKARTSIKRESSLGNLRRKKRHGSQYGSGMHDGSSFPGAADYTPTYTLQKISSMALDECFVHFWQDQLLDDCVATRLPCLVVAQLNQLTAGRLLNSGMGKSLSTNWLIISETVLPPRPALPYADTIRGKRSLSIIRRKGTFASINTADDARSERKSIDGASIRSNWTSGINKTRNGIRRMSNVLTKRISSGQGESEQDKLDREWAELQAEVISRMTTNMPEKAGATED